MRRIVHLFVTIGLLSLLQGCSIQKRTLLPGYYFEKAGKASTPQVFDDAFASINEMESDAESDVMWVQVVEEESSFQPGESGIQSRSKRLAKINRISPHMNGSTLTPRRLQLVDPKPWDAAYQSQKAAGNFALIALCASILLIVVGVGNPMVVVISLLTTLVALVVNRRKRKEVLDIQELEGIDVDEKRGNYRNTNKLIGGTLALGAVLTTILIVSLISFMVVLLTF